MAEVPQALPPGWACKYDHRTSRFYYINHYTRVTTWEDPRLRYRQMHGTPTHVPALATEYIPLQHGTPDSRRNYVYPSQPCPQPAFQMPKTVPVQDFNNVSRGSSTSNRASPMLNNRVSQVVARMQETSLTPAVADAEQSVSKISTMFPTVTDAHIRLLLKKYYNREAVVISALQVEKYPITTPGPFTTPPLGRSGGGGGGPVPLHMTPPAAWRTTPRSGSPVARPNSADNSPKPHSSPKMKLRYLKHVFPQVEETILLEVLGNNDNHVQKASDCLKVMGFEKREMRMHKAQSTKPEPSKPAAELAPKLVQPPRLVSLEEKKDMKQSLQEMYKDIPERVIMIALESVDYNKERAIQILEVMVQEEASPKGSVETSPKLADSQIEETTASELLKKSKSSLITPSPSVHTLQTDKLEISKARRTKEKKNAIRETQPGLSGADTRIYKSLYLIKSSGPNTGLAKGSDNAMLLEDYVSWDGPDPNLREGHNRRLAQGPNDALLSQRAYQPLGPNAEHRKGPVYGLAKGSIYTHLKTTVGAESRGK